MSGTDYNYDEQVRLSAYFVRALSDTAQGQFFPFFILTITTLVTVPTTISFLRPSKGMHPLLRLPHQVLIPVQSSKIQEPG